MSNYVVDASVVVQFLVTEAYTDNARALFRGLIHDDRVVMPEFCLLECANVLWKRVRFHGMAPSTADLLVNDLINLPLTIYGAADFLKRSLELGLTHQLALYDSVYIALAEMLNYPLITVDERQAKAAQTEGIMLKPITDFAPLGS